MAKCPFCTEELSSAELQAKLCMSCGTPLPASLPGDDKVSAGPGVGTESPGVGPPPAAPEAPSPAAEGDQAATGDTARDERVAETFAGETPPPAGKTPAEDRFATTVDSAGGFLSASDKDPQQDPRLAETVQSQDQFVPAEDAPETSPPSEPDRADDDSPKGDTTDDKRMAATIQTPQDLVPPAEAEEQPPKSGDEDERIARTMDSGSIGLTPPLEGKESVDGARLDATMDSGDSARFAQTLDSTGSSRFAQTLDSTDSSRFEQTIESGDSSRFAQTLDSGSVGSAMEERVSMVWSGTFQPETTPRSSIKADAVTLESQAHLVIKQRVMAESQDTSVARADYEVISKLGEGGMGVVYAARQAAIDRTVAVKMLKPASAKNHEERGKFLSEAIVTGDLEHPNIVPIYDVGKREDGALFYSMKRVKGTPWDTVIGEKSFAENIEILQKVADAVGFAHSRDVVHRDLKPENVMLGDFGEVLLMDWGLALSSSADPSTTGMGGTPAYMAPEMATGPIDAIGPASDIYLLGAILYEIVTDTPPHTGKSVMDCLFAAARNEIVPPKQKEQAERPDERITIAMKAMATDPKERHETVVAFQDAIRDYQSHSESISLSTRADEDLAEAQETKNYQTFARARFGFQEAYDLWDGNERAKAGGLEASLAYATTALEKGDLDLGASLLDPQDAEHAVVLDKIRAALQEREARQQRLKTAKRIGYGLVATIFLVISVAFVWIRASYNEAVAQKTIAQNQTIIAEQKTEEATAAKAKAESETEKARIAEDRAKEEAEKARVAEDTAKDEAEKARIAEDKAIEEAENARIAKENEEYGAYIARIGLAAAKIEENAFDKARELLDLCPERLRDWEWGRLSYLCSRDITTYEAGWELETIAVSRDGQRMATAGWNGQVYLANVQAPNREVKLGDGQAGELVLETGSEYVFALAFSPDGRRLAVGCNALGNNPQGAYVQIWDAETGKREKILGGPQGHEDAVLSVTFSESGDRLLTSSYDSTARLWDLATGDVIKVFAGHDWWVWSAAFSPDERRIVTTSQDGSAIVWSVETGEPGPPFLGHAGPIYSAVFSADGTHIATAGYDKQILIWNPDEIEPYDVEATLESGTRPLPKYRALAGHSAAVRSVSFSPDGKRLVSGGYDNTVRVWDATTGKLLKILRGHAGRVPACVFSPDGHDVFSASLDGKAKRWNIEGYEEVRVFRGRVLEGHDDVILGADFSPNGSRVVTASRDRSAKLWNPVDGSELKEFKEGHEFLASTVLFFPDAKRIVTAATDNTTRIWDVTLGTEQAAFVGTGPSSAVALSHDGTWLLTGSDDKTAKVWDVATGRLVQQLVGHNSEITAVAVSPQSKWALTADSVGRCRLWDTKTWKLAWEAKPDVIEEVTAARFLPNGQRVLTAARDYTVTQWDVASGKADPRLILGHESPVIGLAVAPDGTRALTVCADRYVRLWDVNLARKLDQRAIPQPPEAAIWKTESPGGMSRSEQQREAMLKRQSVSAVAFDRTGQRALVVTEDNRVRLWEITGAGDEPLRGGAEKVVADAQTIGDLAWSATFSPNGRQIVTVGGEAAQMWDLDDGAPTMRFSRQLSVASARFSPDGSHVVTGSWDNAARIWSVETGRAEQKLAGSHKAFINSAIYSRDGKRILTASDDNTIIVWDVATGQALRTLEGHTDRVRSAVFSPDREGKWVLSASNDKTARIWDAATGDCLDRLEGHTQAVLCAAFSSDGKRVITAGEDNVARLWELGDDGAWQPVMVESTASRGEPNPSNTGAATPGSEEAPAGEAADNAIVDTQEPGAEGTEPEGEAAGKIETVLEPLRLEGHTAAITSVAFSPNDLRVITGSADSTAKVWDVKTGSEILTLAGHSDEVTAVSISPQSTEGQSILTGSRDGTCILWLAEAWDNKEETADRRKEDRSVVMRHRAE